MQTKIEVTFIDGTKEEFEGVVSILGTGWFQISTALEDSGSLLSSVEDRTNSVYIPQTAIRKVHTLNE